jgi:hypothetical protein
VHFLVFAPSIGAVFDTLLQRLPYFVDLIRLRLLPLNSLVSDSFSSKVPILLLRREERHQTIMKFTALILTTIIGNVAAGKPQLSVGFAMISKL